MVQRDADAPGHRFLRPFAWSAQIDRDRVAGGDPLGRQRRTDAFGCSRQVRPRLEAPQSVLEVADDVIEADTAEAYGGFVLAAGIRDDHDRAFSVEDGPRP